MIQESPLVAKGQAVILVFSIYSYLQGVRHVR